MQTGVIVICKKVNKQRTDSCKIFGIQKKQPGNMSATLDEWGMISPLLVVSVKSLFLGLMLRICFLHQQAIFFSNFMKREKLP